MELPRQIPYNPRWPSMLLCAALFAVAAAVMALEAARNTEGVEILGLVILGPLGATISYWIMSGLAAGLVLAGIVVIWRGIARPKVLELETDSLLLPHGAFQRKTSRIAYADIQQVKEDRVWQERFLEVTAGGRRYTITASLLPDNETYTSVREFLRSQVPR